MGVRKYPLYNPLAYAGMSVADFILKLILPRDANAISTPKKLLICNGAHLGDVILTTALLPAIKEAYPEIKLGMAIGSWSLPVIQNHPLIDTIHIVDHWKQNRSKKGRYLKTRRLALQEIKAFCYDVAIDCCFHFPNFAPLLWQAKIPVRIGFESAGLSPFLTHQRPWRADENISAAASYFSLLTDFLHIAPTSLKPSLPLEPPKKKEPYFVVHMGAGSEKKQWPLEKWRGLTKKLLEKRDLLYFTGKGESEHAQIEKIRTQFPEIKNLCDCLSWSEFVALIQNASLLIGVDSSAGHIAAATNTPALLLYTGMHPPNLWHPCSKGVHILSKKLPCSPCFKGCSTMRCIQEISIDEVYEKIEDLRLLFRP